MMFDGRHYFQGMHEYDANAISLLMEIDKVCLVNYICLILLSIMNRVTISSLDFLFRRIAFGKMPERLIDGQSY